MTNLMNLGMMKRIFTLLFILYALSSQAQYLPNGSFDSWKSSCGSTDAVGEMRQRPGIEPTSWNGSSVNQKVSGVTKEQQLVFNDNGSVKLQNIYVGVNLVLTKIGSVAPGYITLGTPWVYATSSVSKCDGGTYGGNSFTNKPDAITGRFKRTDSNSENSYIVAYLWKGTFKSNVGEKGSPSQSRDNVDRAIMGMSSATSAGTLVAKCNYAFSSTGGAWKTITVPIEYLNNETPEMMNVVISGGDYWSRGNLKENTTLYVDDVNFVYYSELASLTYNGKNYFQQGKTSYTIDELYDESKLSVTSNGRGAVIEKSFNSSTNVLTITVKGNDCVTRSNSKIQSYSLAAVLAYTKNMAAASSNIHTYTINFKTVEPLAVVDVTPDETVESLKTITLEYNDEIAGTYSASNTSKIYLGSSNNTASFSVNGKVLTITLDKAIATTGEYALYIPEGLITRKFNGEAVTCNGEIKFGVKVTPLEVVAVTPAIGVESLKKITVEYSDEIAGTYNAGTASKIYVGSNSNTASFSVSGKVLTITLDKAIATTGEYALYIPEGLVTRKLNGEPVTCSGELKFRVEVAPLEVVSVTPNSVVESLKTITVEYSGDIAGTYNAGTASKIYLGSSNNTASFSVSGNVLTITLDKAIATTGEYALYIPEGLITRKLNDEPVICNGELKFGVEVAPLEVVAVTPNSAVESLKTMTIEYSDEIAGIYNAGAASKIYVGSSSNTASFSVSGRVLSITLDNAITTPGNYALTIPSGLITRKLNGEPVTCNGGINFTVKASIDYTPAYTGRKSNTARHISSVTMSSSRYPNAASNTFTVDNSTNPCYSDYTGSVLMKAAPGETVTLAINEDDATSWMNVYAYIDADNDGFAASIANGSNWLPAGDLVSYSFYNNNDPYDANGWNSVGAVISGNNRSTVSLPAFAVPAKAGIYRVRVKLDWCNIDPNGDSDGKFGDFMDNGGQIVDFMLEVAGAAMEEPEPAPGEDVDYTPANTGTRDYAERNINAVTFTSAQYGDVRYDLTATERANEYLDLTAKLEFLAAPGEEVSIAFDTQGSWINHYVYIDYDADGFTASIAAGSNWQPAEDLVTYSFYNNGGNSDNSGWNSLGQAISGDDRSYPSLPSFTVPARTGRYRLRIKQDWCSIEPAGDCDSNFGGTFSNYGGQIIDVILRVSDPTAIESVGAESGVKVIYDMQGRRLDEITKPGIYIVNGKKILVK